MTHDFSFDPTYGYDERSLRGVGRPPAPADFADFWRARFSAAIRVLPIPSVRPIRRGRGVELSEIEFDGWSPHGGPFRLGGWLSVPIGRAPTVALVVAHGYGGRDGPDLSPLIDSAAVIYPCLRGFGRSASPDIPDAADRHVLHGIGSRDSYVHGINAADVWAAVSTLAELFPGVPVGFAGASFGGGIGALAVPWDRRIGRAFLDFPSFGNHPLRLTMPCVGSGEAVRQSGGDRHLAVLQYVDAATAAAFTTTPTLVAAALFDPAVPPPGQFAVYNCLAGEKKLFVRKAAHFDWAGAADEDRIVRRLASQWLAAG